jgi:phosphoserine phosphatase
LPFAALSSKLKALVLQSIDASFYLDIASNICLPSSNHPTAVNMLTIKSCIDWKTLLLFFCYLIVRSECIRHPTDTGSALILLDVDNTLYSEVDAGIEAQIVQNTHNFCRNELGVTPSEADRLFHEYGSTVEGLRRTLWQDYDEDQLQESLRDFYEKVYQNIDMSRLLLTSGRSSTGSTGYSHASQERRLVCQLLKACPDPIAIASNSPSWHVQKVLQCMGLDRLEFEEVLTPDRLADFPTKHEPIAYFAGSSTRQRQNGKILFFDDSLNNLDRVSAVLEKVEPVHVKAPSNTLGDALSRHLGLVNHEYVFDAVKYLESKNIVDSQAIHPEIWNQVIAHLRNSIQKERSIHIVDVGAGRLNILSLLLLGETSRGLNALFGHPKNDFSIFYTAYESNEKLLPACQKQLQSLGFYLVESVSEKEFVYSKENWTVRLILANFDEADAGEASPDLIVGCCFADLMDPALLVPSLLHSFRLLEDRMPPKATLLYFPITFAGATQFLPPRPFEPSPESSSRTIPADTTAFQIYSKALIENMGHNLDPFLLKQAMEDYGVTFLAKGASDWKIDHADVPYLFETMLYFFGTTAGPPLLEAGADAAGWIPRARRGRPTIQVSNVDLLFQIGGRQRTNSADVCDPVRNSSQTSSTLREIQFTAPESVTTIQKDIPELGPDEVLGKATPFVCYKQLFQI